MRLVAVLAVAGCLSPDLHVCGDGRACPADTTCNDALHTCVSPDQLVACESLADGDPCALVTGEGTCILGACFESRCGDRVVEPGEVCDDGNLVSGDGCSASCRTAELCGDGAREASLGEECDDGNLVSGDGCDSRCVTETVTWTVEQCGAPNGAYPFGTFDVRRGRLVVYDAGFLSEWTGTTWECVAVEPGADGRQRRILALVYDPVREHVLAFEPDGVRAWDGLTWSVVSMDTSPVISAIAYDSAADRFWSYNVSSPDVVSYWDPVSVAWTSQATPPSPRPGFNAMVAAYDAQADRIVAAQSGASYQTWVWDRKSATWTLGAANLPVQAGAALAYSPALGNVVAFGGSSGVNLTGNLYAWSGNSWDLVTASTDPQLARADALLVYDASTSSLVMTGGTANNTLVRPDVNRLTASGWQRTVVPGLMPDGISTLASLPANRTVIAVTSDGASWSYDGTTWTELVTLHPGPMQMTYRPDTQRIVGYDDTGRLSELDGTDWTTLAMDSGSIPAAGAIAYDPSRGTLMLHAISESYVRGPTGWDPLPGSLHKYFPSLAYDYHSGQMMLAGNDYGSTLSVHRRVGDDWQQAFAFSGNFFLPFVWSIEHGQRGTVMFASGGNSELWEVTGDDWRHFTSPFPASSFPMAVYDIPRGDVLLLDTFTHRMISVGFHSATPRESCVDGDDLDGDGASGCDDKDCWWRCAPTCPPGSSCF